MYKRQIQKILFYLFILQFLPLSLSEIPNCIKKSPADENICLKCSSGYVALNQNLISNSNNRINASSCAKCEDYKCTSCYNTGTHSCLECEPPYKLIKKSCAIKCNDTSLPNCNYCLKETSICLSCSKGCLLIDEKCYCTSRNIILILIGIFSVLFIVMIIYLINNNKFCLKYDIVEAGNGINIPIKQKMGKKLNREFQKMVREKTNEIYEKPYIKNNISNNSKNDKTNFCENREFENAKNNLNDIYINNKYNISLGNKNLYNYNSKNINVEINAFNTNIENDRADTLDKYDVLVMNSNQERKNIDSNDLERDLTKTEEPIKITNESSILEHK